MGSSIFSAMSSLKVVITTWAYLPIIPSIDRKNREEIPLFVSMLPVLVLLQLSSPMQKLIHYLCLPISCVIIWNLTSMTTSVWISHRPLIDMPPVFLECSHRDVPPLWSAASLVDYGFDIFAVRVEDLSSEVDHLVTYLIVACNDKTSVASNENVLICLAPLSVTVGVKNVFTN